MSESDKLYSEAEAKDAKADGLYLSLNALVLACWFNSVWVRLTLLAIIMGLYFYTNTQANKFRKKAREAQLAQMNERADQLSASLKRFSGTFKGEF